MTKQATHSRRAFLAALTTTALAGCGGTNDVQTTTSESASDSTETATTADSTSGIEPPLAESTLPLPMAADDLSEHVLSGGVPKDGIPAIDEPSFESATEAADRLNDFSVVFGVERDGVAKAYPSTSSSGTRSATTRSGATPSASRTVRSPGPSWASSVAIPASASPGSW